MNRGFEASASGIAWWLPWGSRLSNQLGQAGRDIAKSPQRENAQHAALQAPELSVVIDAKCADLGVGIAPAEIELLPIAVFVIPKPDVGVRQYLRATYHLRCHRDR